MGDESPKPASTPTGAVFLSYASQDAEAAQRICDALRAAGIEVWFDKSELRGGDVWDRQIREQIHDCRLFIPVISANTEARDEGYFRREWGLAVDRTRDMDEKKAFLLPVVIDDTVERSARVPERFHGIQWTRLLAGLTPPAFVARVRKLLSRGEPDIHQAGGVPSLTAFFSSRRNSGVSSWPWVATACWTATSSNSFSVSAEMVTVQFISLGNSLQSIYLRPMSPPNTWIEALPRSPPRISLQGCDAHPVLSVAHEKIQEARCLTGFGR